MPAAPSTQPSAASPIEVDDDHPYLPPRPPLLWPHPGRAAASTSASDASLMSCPRPGPHDRVDRGPRTRRRARAVGRAHDVAARGGRVDAGPAGHRRQDDRGGGQRRRLDEHLGHDPALREPDHDRRPRREARGGLAVAHPPPQPLARLRGPLDRHRRDVGDRVPLAAARAEAGRARPSGGHPARPPVRVWRRRTGARAASGRCCRSRAGRRPAPPGSPGERRDRPVGEGRRLDGRRRTVDHATGASRSRSRRRRRASAGRRARPAPEGWARRAAPRRTGTARGSSASRGGPSRSARRRDGRQALAQERADGGQELGLRWCGHAQVLSGSAPANRREQVVDGALHDRAREKPRAASGPATAGPGS